MTRPDAENSPGQQTPANGEDSKDIGALRSLLVGPEEEEIRKIKERLDNPRHFAREVGRVLGPALRHSTDHGFDIGKELGPPVEEAVRRFIQDDPNTVADAIFPVIGPAIRKSIAASLRGLVESVNRSLEHSFTLKGLRWRLEARRTGRPFAEVVLLHSLIYRVEQVFLIHRDTGLLLEHVVGDSVESQDPDMISGMLTAIQDFVRDSFSGGGEQGLDSLSLGETNVLLEHGPKAVIAAVVRGQPPVDLRRELVDAIEDIHREHGYFIDRFDGDAKPFEVTRPRLQECLAAQYQEGEGEWRGIPRWVWIGVALVALSMAALAWRNAQAEWRWQRYVDVLNDQPGIVVTGSERSSDGGVVRGMRDPLAGDLSAFAVNSGLEPDKIQLRWQPFQSLEPRIVLERARRILSPPPTVDLAFEDGRLQASGTATREWLVTSATVGRALPGVREVDFSSVRDGVEEFWQAVSEVDGFRVRFSLASTAPKGDLMRMVARILEIEGMAEALSIPVEIGLIGRTDDSGDDNENRELSLHRAQWVEDSLRAAGLRLPIRVEGRGSADPISGDPSGQINRSVTINVWAQESS